MLISGAMVESEAKIEPKAKKSKCSFLHFSLSAGNSYRCVQLITAEWHLKRHFSSKFKQISGTRFANRLSFISIQLLSHTTVGILCNDAAELGSISSPFGEQLSS